jgi:hypothetical protein
VPLALKLDVHNQCSAEPETESPDNPLNHALQLSPGGTSIANG